MAQDKQTNTTDVYWDGYEHDGHTFYAAMTERGVAGTSIGSETFEEFAARIRKRYKAAEVRFTRDPDKLSSCIGQLRDYFAGRLQQFDLPLDLHGTAFQKSVWDALNAIPYGQVKSYGDIAREIGNIKAVRAVGGACGANPVPIIVPCHRVIGSNRSLTGFAGGVDLKERMLQMEGVHL